MFREDVPPDIAELAGSEVDFKTGVDSIYYYQTHVMPPTWGADPTPDWNKVIDKHLDAGLSHKGYDYPDWRQFALLDFSAPVRATVSTKSSWYADIDFVDSDDIVSSTFDSLQSTDHYHKLKALRAASILPTRSDDELAAVMLTLLTCKAQLILAGSVVHDTYLPIYLDICGAIFKRFGLHNRIIERDTVWPVLSITHLWSYEVGQLDVSTFRAVKCWLVSCHALLTTSLGIDL